MQFVCASPCLFRSGPGGLAKMATESQDLSKKDFGFKMVLLMVKRELDFESLPPKTVTPL